MSHISTSFRSFASLNSYCTIIVTRKTVNQFRNNLKSFPQSFRKQIGLLLVSSPYIFGSAIVAPAEKNEVNEINSTIPLADQLFNQHSYTQLYDLLIQFKDADKSDILWRLARAAYYMSLATSSKEEKKKFHYESYGYLERALELDPDNFNVHRWLFVLIDSKASHEGMKARILEAFRSKDHILRACELNPKDATAFHFLGFWCFEVAGLPWYQRKIASTLFASPPTSTYEEALQYLLKAEEIEPNFYSDNLLMIGRTYLCLNDKENAKIYLTKAKDYPVMSPKDAEVKIAAEIYLKGL